MKKSDELNSQTERRNWNYSDLKYHRMWWHQMDHLKMLASISFLVPSRVDSLNERDFHLFWYNGSILVVTKNFILLKKNQDNQWLQTTAISIMVPNSSHETFGTLIWTNNFGDIHKKLVHNLRKMNYHWKHTLFFCFIFLMVQ